MHYFEQKTNFNDYLATVITRSFTETTNGKSSIEPAGNKNNRKNMTV